MYLTNNPLYAILITSKAFRTEIFLFAKCENLTNLLDKAFELLYNLIYDSR